MPGESLIAHWTPHTFLMKGIQLMLVIHVMILASHVSKGGLANVAFVDRLGMSHSQMVAQNIGTSKNCLAYVTLVRRHGAVRSSVTVQLEMLLELQTFVESLPANFANGRHFASVLSHMVQKVFFFAEDKATDVTSVLDFARMDGNVLLEAVEAGELTLADGAHEEARVVLHGSAGIGHFWD